MKVLSQGAAAAPGPGTPGLRGGISASSLVGRMDKLLADDHSLLEARGVPGFLAPTPASWALPASQEAGLATAGARKAIRSPTKHKPKTVRTKALCGKEIADGN